MNAAAARPAPIEAPAETYAGAVGRLEIVHGEVIAITGTAGDIAEAEAEGQAAGLAFRDGDVIQIGFRDDPSRNRPQLRSVLYGPTGREVAQILSRVLDRPVAELRAEPAGDPRPFDLTWICCDATGQRLARVRGFSSVWMNLALGRRDLAGRIAMTGPGPGAPVPFDGGSHTARSAADPFPVEDETFLEPVPEAGDDA